MNDSTIENYTIFNDDFFTDKLMPLYHYYLDAPSGLRSRTGRKVMQINPFFEVNLPKVDYVREIFIRTEFIKESIKKLRLIEFYLNVQDIPKHYIDNGISEKDYYRYHVEYFHIKCVSVIDFIHLLTNFTYCLGIPKGQCNYHVLIKNENLKNSDTLKSLKALNEEFKDIISDRQSIIHRGDFEHETLENIDREVKFSNMLKSNTVDGHLFKDRKVETIQKTVDLFNSQIDKLENHYSQVLVTLLPTIDKKYKIFDIE